MRLFDTTPKERQIRGEFRGPEYYSLDAQIGRAVRKLRKQRGMSLSELGEKVGYTVGHLSNLERGIGSFPSGKLYDISKALNRPIHELVEA